MNTALLAKTGARLALGSQAVWATVLCAKYVQHRDLLDCEARPTDSRQWKGFIRGFNMIKGGFGWRIGNGESVSLWFDTWLYNDPLCLLIDDIHPNEITWTVADVIHEGAWALHRLRTILSPDLIRRIQEVPLQVTGCDSLVWKGTGSAVPTVRSFFQFITRSQDAEDGPSEDDWQWVWKVRCPQKIRFFLWLAAHDRLITNAYRSRIGLAETDLCPRCHQYSESILHILRDC